jgi:hypothetical protein
MADDQELSNAVDQEERTFEVVKLRIAFLQHITTLSGAAILIVLALAERAETTRQALLLTSTVTFFLAAALIAVNGVVFLLMQLMHMERVVGRGRATAGSFTTFLTGGVFSAAMISVVFYAAGGTRRMVANNIENVYLLGGALLALVFVLIALRINMRWILSRYYDYDPDDPPS